MHDDRSDISKAPVPPLRAEPRFRGAADEYGHIRGVDASAGGLMRATLGAAVAAGAILGLFWLPAEYGIDPTGVGGMLGLTEMGEIKQQLYAEAAADEAAQHAQTAPAAVAATVPDLLERLDRIEAQVATIAAVIGAVPPATGAEPGESAERAPAATSVSATAATAEPATPEWRDEISFTLAPGESAEWKLVMAAGELAQYRMIVEGGKVNFDLHGHGSGQSVTYERARGSTGSEGGISAGFPGEHGWFWRNRDDQDVTVTLKVRGEYRELRQAG